MKSVPGKLAALSLSCALAVSLAGCGVSVTGVSLDLPDSMEKGTTLTAVPEYTFDGATKPMHYVNDTRKFPLNRNNTIMYDIADAMFMSVYQQHFDDIVVP